jgi:asparagine synthase (glutamine-hydrolysing)
MCGIAGIFCYSPDGGVVQRDELLTIRDSMTRRGPDGAGIYVTEDRRVGLAHRRLSIIDLSDAGAQPMSNQEGTLCVTFNGEIYNYRELRQGLEQRGYRFQSNTDTEVLLHLYAHKGMQMLDDLRGMYAFALWDEGKHGMLLATDPFGMKPLYYADDGSTFRFASQVKALLAGGQVDTSPDPAGHVGFFLWGSVPQPHTMYRSIHSLLAGRALWVDEQGVRQKRFCSIARELAPSDAETESCLQADSAEELRGALKDSVAHHMIADVPVSVFLSAGLDSTTLAALAMECVRTPVQTVTLSFDEHRGTDHDEAALAESVARHYGTSQQTLSVTRHHFQAEAAAIFAAMDQPTIDGINTYFVSQAAASVGAKVALSGVGGDEIFGGYPSFRQVPKLVDLSRPLSELPLIGKGFRWVSTPCLKAIGSPKYAGLIEYGGSYGGAYLLRRGLFMPWELPNFLDGDFVRQGWRELQTMACLDETVHTLQGAHAKVSALELCWYMRNQLLRDTDWAGMAHSLEIRTPLVDLRLLRRIAHLTHQGVFPSKRDMALTPSLPLPPAILSRPKSGFAVPIYQWLQKSQPTEEGKGKARDHGHRGWAKRVYAEYPTSSSAVLANAR